SKAAEAAKVMRMTAAEILSFGVIEAVVPEPVGGAHHDWAEAAGLLQAAAIDQLRDLKTMSAEDLVRTRVERFGRIGVLGS
ncbi:MAG: acetyl-CoA carboxylase carboxyl transferase subunit alpha, partial [bacterium]